MNSHTKNENLLKWFEFAPMLSNCKLRAYISEYDESNEQLICPPSGLVFRAFESMDPEQVRVVILGQDPYHTLGKASGLAFGYHPSYRGRTDSSLANIIAEVDACYPGAATNFDRSLEGWARQGVLLLNTRLTCEVDKPMSHAGKKIGWEKEILRVLRHLNAIHQANIVWVAWGAHAQKMIGKVTDLTFPNVICTSHPCRFSNTATDKPFTGSKCFSRINEYLKSIGREEIAWTSK